ncbi:MAG: helix-turn-helix domain-containing protein [Acidimicrobiia bacterium]
MDDWRERVRDLRVDASARSVLELLPSHPVVSAALVAQLLGISTRAARTALDVLTTRRVTEPFDVKPSRPGRPPQWWLARELVETVSAWAQ